MIFIGKGSSAVGRSFEATGAELYCCWACGGLYKLSCRGSLALVKEEGEASGACADGACAGRASVDGACVGGACAGGAYAGRASIEGACVGGACADGACTGKRSFETARARARVADDVKGVNKRDLR